ncbi:unnamed protein product [Pleuronectes platessa]|uniref:Uncharacterized protein n=1 Tax=Pleuronectes platessa TaxID=8262 RepID=A0A9N7Z7I4_PLEPL|nr:unnamed protein product [Pleuronectes platessa]
MYYAFLATCGIVPAYGLVWIVQWRESGALNKEPEQLGPLRRPTENPSGECLNDAGSFTCSRRWTSLELIAAFSRGTAELPDGKAEEEIPQPLRAVAKVPPTGWSCFLLQMASVRAEQVQGLQANCSDMSDMLVCLVTPHSFTATKVGPTPLRRARPEQLAAET